MTRIDGTNGVNNNVKINLANVKENSKTSVNSTFGEGFASSDKMGFVSVDSRFQALASKFDFDVPKYPKGGFAQFAPTDTDYEAMKHLDAALDKPEVAYSEC